MWSPLQKGREGIPEHQTGCLYLRGTRLGKTLYWGAPVSTGRREATSDSNVLTVRVEEARAKNTAFYVAGSDPGKQSRLPTC